jgi:hypothetical protein
MFSLLSIVSFAKTDESNSKSDQNYFIISQEAIEVQKDETQLEQQRLAKEAEYNLQREIKNNYMNEMWSTYSATIQLVTDLGIMLFLVIFVRLIFFIMFELLPYGLNKLVDNLEGWFQ